MKRFLLFIMVLLISVFPINLSTNELLSPPKAAAAALDDSTTAALDSGCLAPEAEMLDSINTARSSAGVSPLVLDDALTYGAVLKVNDMVSNNYFSHISPTYGSPIDMMNSLGITHTCMGENLAKNFSVKGAFDAFMNSPHHRDNLLRPEFTKIGLGFYQSGSYLYVSQWFTD
ncbi:MAG TPA: CAP domain-containing protein [Syntrophomonadaceae bacterium]|nr:CAP domain-containing protein [Syntrophomonadaceae bacterium]